MTDDPNEKADEWAKQTADMAEAVVHLYRFYSRCIAEGFTEEQAMTLTIAILTRPADHPE